MPVFLHQLQNEVFEKLKNKELTPKEFLAEHAKTVVHFDEIRDAIEGYALVLNLMALSCFIALYDWVFAPWKNWALLEFALMLLIPIAMTLKMFLGTLDMEIELMHFLVRGEGVVADWDLKDRSDVVALLNAGKKDVLIFGKCLDKELPKQFILLIMSLTVLMFQFPDWEGFGFDRFEVGDVNAKTS